VIDDLIDGFITQRRRFSAHRFVVPLVSSKCFPRSPEITRACVCLSLWRRAGKHHEFDPLTGENRTFDSPRFYGYEH